MFDIVAADDHELAMAIAHVVGFHDAQARLAIAASARAADTSAEYEFQQINQEKQNEQNDNRADRISHHRSAVAVQDPVDGFHTRNPCHSSPDCVHSRARLPRPHRTTTSASGTSYRI
jgi:hypothetical protein